MDLTKTYATTKAAPVAPNTYRFKASTGSVDADGDTLNVHGWKLDRFKFNPTILAAHSHKDWPIARATKVWVADDALKVDIEFPEPGV
jgi:hypothetical protein